VQLTSLSLVLIDRPLVLGPPISPPSPPLPTPIRMSPELADAAQRALSEIKVFLRALA
jgi:hypothetical protein